MIRLSWSSLRSRPMSMVAVLLTIFCGTVLTVAFGSMLDVAGGPRATSDDATMLQTMASVVGIWGGLIVAASVVTTTLVITRQRAAEVGLLRSTGATPRQMTRMVTAEVMFTSLIGAVVATPVGALAGRGLLDLLQHSDQVSAGVSYRFGVGSLVLGPVATLVIAWISTSLAVRHIARRPVQEILRGEQAIKPRIGRARTVLGVVLVLAGLSCATTTATVMDGSDIQTQSIAGEAAILPALGFALLAPPVLRWVATLLSPVLWVFGGSGRLGALETKVLARRRASTVIPVALFVALASVTLYMQAEWNDRYGTTSSDDKFVATINYVVVGTLAVFAAVMVANLVVAVVMSRRREFAQFELTGATRRQVIGISLTDTALTTATGVLLGSVAAMLGVGSYAKAVDGDLMPSAGPGIYVAVVVSAFVIAAAAAFLATRRALHGTAVQTVRLGAES